LTFPPRKGNIYGIPVEKNLRSRVLYRVHFKWKDKEIQLMAKSLDMTHPYFVSIKELVFKTGKKLIINPSEDEVKKAFSETDHVMIPFQSIILIEELTKPGGSKVMPFGLVEDEEEKKEDM
jgi:hypothetical protein